MLHPCIIPKKIKLEWNFLRKTRMEFHYSYEVAMETSNNICKKWIASDKIRLQPPIYKSKS